MAVAVLSSIGKKLMPTSNYHARRLLKKGRAVIAKHKPVFTIRMTDREDGETQAGDKVLFDGKIRIVKGSHRKGEKYNIEFKPDGLKPKSACLEKVTLLHRKGGWGVSSHE